MDSITRRGFFGLLTGAAAALGLSKVAPRQRARYMTEPELRARADDIHKVYAQQLPRFPLCVPLRAGERIVAGDRVCANDLGLIVKAKTGERAYGVALGESSVDGLVMVEL